MLVTTEQEMQSIINSGQDLEWDGWDIVRYTKSNSAMYSPDGVYVRGQWMKKKIYPITRDGWYLPNTIGRADARVEG